MPLRITPLKPKQVVAALLKADFYVHHQLKQAGLTEEEFLDLL